MHCGRLFIQLSLARDELPINEYNFIVFCTNKIRYDISLTFGLRQVGFIDNFLWARFFVFHRLANTTFVIVEANVVELLMICAR